MAKKRSSAQPKSGSKPTPQLLLAAWPRYLAALLAGLAAFLLVGAVPFFGPSVARAIVTGCVVGLSIRSAAEIPLLSGVAAVSALIPSLALSAWMERIEAPPLGAGVILACVVTAPLVAAGLGYLRGRGLRQWAAAAALLVVGCVFLYSLGVLPGPYSSVTFAQRAQLAVEPVAEQYAADNHIFTKTSFLVDAGVPYYQAFLQAYVEDSRFDSPPPMLVNVRQPWLYYIWKVLPGQSGIKLWDWLVVLVLTTAGLAFWGLRENVGDAVALAAASAVLGYMTFGVLSPWFSVSEYWAGCLALCAVMAMLRRRPYPAALLVVTAFAAREIAAWVIVVFGVWWLFSEGKKRTWPALAIATVGPIALFAAHAAMSPVKFGGGQGLSMWANGGFDALVAAATFSGDTVPGSGWLYPALAFMAIVGAALLRDRAEKAAALTSGLLVVAMLGFFSSGMWGYYWGAVGMPTSLVLAFLVLGPLADERPEAFIVHPGRA